jgi:hypothetical protein
VTGDAGVARQSTGQNLSPNWSKLAMLLTHRSTAASIEGGRLVGAVTICGTVERGARISSQLTPASRRSLSASRAAFKHSPSRSLPVRPNSLAKRARSSGAVISVASARGTGGRRAAGARVMDDDAGCGPLVRRPGLWYRWPVAVA